MRSIEYKASPSAQSDSVVVSFDSKWLEPLVAGDVHSVIRRRFPKARTPIWLYAYVNSPVSGLVCRSRIVAIDSLTLSDALGQASNLLLSSDEIRDYFGEYEHLGRYELGRAEVFGHTLGVNRLREAGRFFPPQSFLYLSRDGEDFVNEAVGLSNLDEATL